MPKKKGSTPNVIEYQEKASARLDRIKKRINCWINKGIEVSTFGGRDVDILMLACVRNPREPDRYYNFVVCPDRDPLTSVKRWERSIAIARDGDFANMIHYRTNLKRIHDSGRLPAHCEFPHSKILSDADVATIVDASTQTRTFRSRAADDSDPSSFEIKDEPSSFSRISCPPGTVVIDSDGKERHGPPGPSTLFERHSSSSSDEDDSSSYEEEAEEEEEEERDVPNPPKFELVEIFKRRF